MTNAEIQEALLALEEPASRINGGINAIGVMAMGLSMARDPYADGFNAVWNYLTEANLDFQAQVRSCLKLV